MIRPDDRPWFVPYKPESPDYQKLLDTIARNDELARAISAEKMIEAKTGQPFETMMAAAVHEAAMVAMVCGPGAPVEMAQLGSWLTGFTSGLRKARSIELPENPPDDPAAMLRLMFGDIDEESITFLAAERTSRLAEEADEAMLPTGIAQLASISSLWLDGVITGLTYDGSN